MFVSEFVGAGVRGAGVRVCRCAGIEVQECRCADIYIAIVCTCMFKWGSACIAVYVWLRISVSMLV